MSEPVNQPEATTNLDDLPQDELVLYGRDLGLDLGDSLSRGEVLRRVRQRQALLSQLDRETMLAVCVWAHQPVRQSDSKEALARHIALVTRMDFGGLSHDGLVTLARLRGFDISPKEPADRIIRLMRQAEPLRDWVRRKRRSLIASLVAKAVDASGRSGEGEPDEYKFLPEEDTQGQLKQQIRQKGLVGGIASSIRGAADDYVGQKLDEIEQRIDAKLDQIDRRLAEWRDREIANRLRIIKITLIASILVAALSLGYKHIDRWISDTDNAGPSQNATELMRDTPDA